MIRVKKASSLGTSVFLFFGALLLAAGGVSAQSATDAPQADHKLSVMVLEPSATNPDDKAIATAVSGLIPVELAVVDGLEVLAAADVKQMIEYEAEKQAIGCSDNSCLAELAGALGADLVIFGDVSRLGTLIIVNINLFDSVKTRAAGRISIQTKNVEELPGKLEPAMKKLVGPYLKSKGIPLPAQWSTAVASQAPPPKDDKASTPVATAPVESTSAAEGEATAAAVGVSADETSTLFNILPWAVAGGGVAAGVLGAVVAMVGGALPAIVVPLVVNAAKTTDDVDFYNSLGIAHDALYVMFYGGLTFGALIIVGGGVLAAAGVGWGVVRLTE